MLLVKKILKCLNRLFDISLQINHKDFSFSPVNIIHRRIFWYTKSEIQIEYFLFLSVYFAHVILLIELMSTLFNTRSYLHILSLPRKRKRIFLRKTDLCFKLISFDYSFSFFIIFINRNCYFCEDTLQTQLSRIIRLKFV